MDWPVASFSWPELDSFDAKFVESRRLWSRFLGLGSFVWGLLIDCPTVITGLHAIFDDLWS